MGCGLSSPAAAGQPTVIGDTQHDHHHHDEHQHRHNKPVRKEGSRPLHSRNPSPTASRAGSQWLQHPQSPNSGHDGTRRGSSGLQFLQVTDAGLSSSHHHHLSQGQLEPLDLEHLPLQLLQEINRQRRDAFGLTGEAQQLTLRDDACHEAKEATKAIAEAAKAEDSRPASQDSHGYHLLSRILNVHEAHNLPLFLVNLMAEVRSKSDENSVTNTAAPDLCFWVQSGQFGCAAVQFTRKSAAKLAGSNGSVKQGVNGDTDEADSVVIAMAFRPSDQ